MYKGGPILKVQVFVVLIYGLWATSSYIVICKYLYVR
jgi:hypothetical protein